jgi:hypothetical protein
MILLRANLTAQRPFTELARALRNNNKILKTKQNPDSLCSNNHNKIPLESKVLS